MKMFVYLIAKIDDVKNSMAKRIYMNYMHVWMNIINKYGIS